MAIKHIVLAELNDDVGEDQAKDLFRAICPLLEGIPGVLEVSAGKNFSDRAPGISHALVVTLESKEALEVYGPHPDHDQVRSMLMPLVKNASVVDFET